MSGKRRFGFGPIGFGQTAQIVLGVLVALAILTVYEALTGGFGIVLADGTRISLGWGHHNFSYQEAGWKIAATMRGEVELAEDDRSVVSMGRGAFLEIRERRDGESRRVEMRGGEDERPEIEYRVDGRPREWDAEGRAWLARALPEVLRISGYRAAERVGRILARGGVEALLAEVGEMRVDSSRRIYLAELVRQGGGEEAVLAALGAAGEGIESDHEQRRFLESLEPEQLTSPPALEALEAALATVESDYELRRALEHLLDSRPSPELLASLLGQAQRVGSDYELARFLRSVVDRARDELPPLFFTAAGHLDSDYELRRVLEHVLTEDRRSAGEAREVLGLARGLGSEHERARLLLVLADTFPALAELQPELDREIEAFASEHERRRVAEAVAVAESR